jgi:hypothetical protein
MKILFTILIISLVASSCASQKKPDYSSDRRKVAKHLHTKKIYDDSFSGSWEYHSELNREFREIFSFEGEQGDFIYIVGASESYSFNGYEMDRERLIEEAKQRALYKLYAMGVNQIKISQTLKSNQNRLALLTTVEESMTLKGVKGWSLNYDEYQCIVNKVPMPDLDFHHKRECKVRLKIPITP